MGSATASEGNGEFAARRWTLTLWTLPALLLVSLLGAFALHHRVVHINLGNGGGTTVRFPTMLASCRGSDARMTYKTASGLSGSVGLWVDLFHGPFAVASGRNSEVFFCLYNFDVDLRVLRINTAKAFKPFPPRTPATTSCLSGVVISSPWYIEEAKIDDWETVLEYLRKNPEAFTLGPLELAGSRKRILTRMAEQIKFMRDNGSEDWPVLVTRR